MLAGGLALQGLVTDWHHFGLFGAENSGFNIQWLNIMACSVILCPSCGLSVLSNDSTGRGQDGFRFGVKVPGGQKFIVKKGYNCIFPWFQWTNADRRINVEQKGFVCGVAFLWGRRSNSKHYISEYSFLLPKSTKWMFHFEDDCTAHTEVNWPHRRAPLKLRNGFYRTITALQTSSLFLY